MFNDDKVTECQSGDKEAKNERNLPYILIYEEIKNNRNKNKNDNVYITI